jgi:hypothetical protein
MEILCGSGQSQKHFPRLMVVAHIGNVELCSLTFERMQTHKDDEISNCIVKMDNVTVE